jgi:hypothetical protein
MGHQTVGEIAERLLTLKARTAINNILGPEKLAIAAPWADSVRDDADFNILKPYHFLDIPSHMSYEDIPVNDRALKDSMTVLNKYPLLLENNEEERSVKIVALKYLIHIVGDVHQPLHAGNATDRGGNLCRVQWNEQILNLHAVWDGKIIEYDTAKLSATHSPLKFYSFLNYANDILKSHPLSELEIQTIGSKNFFEWIKESQAAQVFAYPSESHESYCQNSSILFPKITEEYKIKAAIITEERILYAGIRLAFLLNKIFTDEHMSGKNSDLTKDQILKRLDLTNKPEETK